MSYRISSVTPAFPAQCSTMNSRKSFNASRCAARVMRCVDAISLLIDSLRKRVDACLTPDLLHHSDFIPTEVERVQNAIVDSPGASSHSGGLIPFPKSQAIIQALMQRAARLEFALDIIHQFVTAHIGKAAPLEHPGGCVREWFEKIGSMPKHGEEGIDLLKNDLRAAQPGTYLARRKPGIFCLFFCFQVALQSPKHRGLTIFSVID